MDPRCGSCGKSTTSSIGLAVVPTKTERLKLIWMWLVLLLKQAGKLRGDFSAPLTWQGKSWSFSAA